MKTHAFKVAVLVLILSGLSSSLTLAGDTSTDVGRFQLVVVKATESGLVVIKIDTKTGKAWLYDTVNSSIATEDYIKQQGLAQQFNSEKQMELARSGCMATIPPYWKELPEEPSGIDVKLRPTPK
jgi:hypothetical protein